MISGVDLFLISYYDSCPPIINLKACFIGFFICQSIRVTQTVSKSCPDSINQKESEWLQSDSVVARVVLEKKD